MDESNPSSASSLSLILAYNEKDSDTFYYYGFSTIILMNMAGDLQTDDWPEGDLTWWKFQNEDDDAADYTWYIGEDATVWTINTQDPAANVENTVTMAGAASLAARRRASDRAGARDRDRGARNSERGCFVPGRSWCCGLKSWVNRGVVQPWCCTRGARRGCDDRDSRVGDFPL